VSAAREYEARQQEPSLSGFVDQLSLLSDVDEEQGSGDARIILMTMHSAKGLEFPVVVIAGMEEGLFPHSRAGDDDGDLEEERRLCYVGMTRAQDRLILTSAARRRVFGEYRATEPSRFIDEVPPQLLREVPAETQSYRSSYLHSDFRPNSVRRGVGGGGRRVREEQPPAFRYETVVLKNGDVFTGLYRREQGVSLAFVDRDGKEVNVPKSQVVQRRITPFTLMPNNFMDVIPERDLYHLVAYLGTLR
jgi:DNA helicase-2/ATP-dependent DNA helicase PcrA